MREKGFRAENAAAAYMKRQGYKIVERNFSAFCGEIDIIARKDEYLVFAEVKMRKSDAFGGAVYAVNKKKQERIRKTAMLYLQREESETAVRFDVVLVHRLGLFYRKGDIEIIENAFM